MARRLNHIRFGVNKRANNPIMWKYYYQLNKQFPNPKNCIKANGTFHIYGRIKADSNSSLYKVEFIANDQSISVRVHDLSFDKVSLRDIPHIFISESSEKKHYITLCLFRNTLTWRQFNFGDELEDTIIAWTKEWLYFYELFLITGKWYGSGEHPK